MDGTRPNMAPDLRVMRDRRRASATDGARTEATRGDEAISTAGYGPGAPFARRGRLRRRARPARGKPGWAGKKARRRFEGWLRRAPHWIGAVRSVVAPDEGHDRPAAVLRGATGVSVLARRAIDRPGARSRASSIGTSRREWQDSRKYSRKDRRAAGKFWHIRDGDSQATTACLRHRRRESP